MVILSGYLKGQVCTGSLGDPVINIDFGRGASDIGPSLGLADYTYVNSPLLVEDGRYTIAKSTFGMNGGWYNVVNHTPGDPNGYMMVVNADYTPGVFYESTTPIDLCPNTTYEFAAWIINILNRDLNKPNITFIILDLNDRELGRYSTGNIPDRNPVWTQYGFLFTTSGSGGRVKIRMINNAPGGPGNDIALDDITFRACGPRITAGIGATSQAVENLCEHTDGTFRLSAQAEGSATLQFQWQENTTASGWTDVPNATDPNAFDVVFRDALAGKYEYRLTAAEPGNFSAPSCRTVSPVLTIQVNPYPTPQALSNGAVCLGDPIILDVAGATGTYSWRDPAGNIISDQKSPVLNNATFAMAGTYTVTVNSLGCEASASVEVTVLNPPDAIVANNLPEICKGSSVMLEASGGTLYDWTPGTGLSATNIANPIASPTETTLYTVRVSDGACYRTAEVKVIVHKMPEADAGPDRKILVGNKTSLEGKVAGDGISYFWMPTTGMENPQSLNPSVSPSEDITYRLYTLSSYGCETAVDEVFVRVYQKLIIPSAFSPNGDGNNDTWNITALDAFEAPNVKIMNRYGELLYEATGSDHPWDGKHQGQEVPVGVYYYILKLNPMDEPVTGSVTVIR